MSLTAKLILALALFISGLSIGVYHEHEKLVIYKAEQKGVAEAQKKITDEQNTKNDGDKKDANDKYKKDMDNLSNYYKLHPVIRMSGNAAGCGRVSKTFVNTPSVDDTPADQYVSPYSPLDTETVAVRLNDLQQRLIAGGVSIQ
jgi:hypothetical protein